ncbi:MAG: glycerophosphodiester phosphodiesterase [Chloroflexi bacterium]|nr:glycerophosphodiester phosphodiesterase [Chloroflexota bacterium]
MTPLLYGHRGAKGEAPENTLTGFAYAQRVGVTAFELDVRLSADGELMVIHDADVDRTTNGHGPVSDFTARELAALDARAAFPDWPEPAGVPRLADVLDAFGSQHYQIEIKTDAPEHLEIVAAKLVELIERSGIVARTEVASFDPAALEIMRRIAPEIPRAFIGRYDTPDFLATAISLQCAGACIPHKTSTRATVDAAHAAGLHVTGWLGNTQDDVRLLLDWRVESITSDTPSVALPYLRAAAAS